MVLYVREPFVPLNVRELFVTLDFRELFVTLDVMELFVALDVMELFVALDVMRELFSVMCILGVAWCRHWSLGSCLMRCCRLGVAC